MKKKLFFAAVLIIVSLMGLQLINETKTNMGSINSLSLNKALAEDSEANTMGYSTFISSHLVCQQACKKGDLNIYSETYHDDIFWVEDPDGAYGEPGVDCYMETEIYCNGAYEISANTCTI